MSKRTFSLISMLVALAMVVVACTPTPAPTNTPQPVEQPKPTDTTAPESVAPAVSIDCAGAGAGDEVTVLYQWSGTEEESFNAIVKPLVDACGIQVVAQSTRDAAVLDAKAKSTPPDVIFWPTTAPLTLYGDNLLDLASVGADAGNYASFWKDMGSSAGKWMAVPVKADIKTIIWYSPAAFDLFGYNVPTTWDELDALVEQMVADGNVPWSMGMESGAATGWTGSDFIQDILLVQQGPDYVNDIMSGDVSYDDAGVMQAYETYGKWAMDEKYTVGGATGTVSTPFLDAIYKVFSDPAEAMLVKQSGFAGGEVAKQYPDLEYGVDYDFFAVPGAQGMQGGADWMMAFGDSPAAKALVGYLTGAAGAAEWAKVGFDLSPNSQAVGNYTDPALIKKADALAGAAGFTPDIGDTIPAPFGEAEWKAIVDYVNGADLASALGEAAKAQADALSGTAMAGIDCAGAGAGDEVTVLYQWSGTEEESFNAIVKALVDECGIQVVAQSTRDAAVLDAKAKSTPPDVIFWPTTAPLTLYGDNLLDLASVGADAGNYASFWKDMGASAGKWMAVPVKADIKTIIWYSPAAFDLFGYSVPTTWDELDALVEKMVADGNVPWSMGMESGAATGWTGSDFIQDILLVQQGPDYVNDIMSGDVSYDDAGVMQAYETYGKWAMDEKYTVGGATGTVSTPFLDAIYKVFSDPAEAMMVKQSGFAGGEVAKQYPDLEYGVDYDFFAVPGAKGMQGGADWMMAFGDSPAAKALVGYLTSAAGAAEWAKVGFDLSPNSQAVGNYTDPALIKKAAALAGAAGFTPDIGDTIPAPFGEAEWKAIVDYVNGADLASALGEAAKAQADALE